MNRIEGFINLDQMLENNEIIYNEKNTINELDSFIYDDNIIFFKPEPLTFLYNELIASELLKDLNLPCAEYDLAIFQGMEGNITKNYRKDNTNYISGETILEDYMSYLNIETNNNLNMNNLSDLWNALDYRYRDNPNREEIVYKLMNQIVDLFIFDIMTNNGDRTECNFEIMESNDYIGLAPIYDNEHILCGKNYSALNVERDTNNIPVKELEKFVEYSDSTYIDKINSRMWVIEEDNLEKVFKRIEDKINFPIHEEVKSRYITEFKIIKQEIEEVLNNHAKKSK